MTEQSLPLVMHLFAAWALVPNPHYASAHAIEEKEAGYFKDSPKERLSSLRKIGAILSIRNHSTYCRRDLKAPISERTRLLLARWAIATMADFGCARPTYSPYERRHLPRQSGKALRHEHNHKYKDDTEDYRPVVG